uniref:F-box associated interaction domain-containing protein n=1 Tax=Helianthus annuus TaxID=4232 RepID=A0A251T6E2_HELAN
MCLETLEWPNFRSLFYEVQITSHDPFAVPTASRCFRRQRTSRRRGSFHGTRAGLLLGSLDGYLCMVNNVTGSFTFDVWLMKEEGVWLKARSFRFGSEGNVFYPVCILGDGKILIKSSTQLVICDASKDSYKVLNGLATLGNFSRIDRVLHREYYPLMYSRSIEYVESLVSPSDMCSI